MEQYTPEVDAGYGLIYRLNYLWAKVDRDCLAGDFNKWEVDLDRIFSNLLYRNSVEIIRNKNEKICSVKIADEDINVWRTLKEDIKKAKKEVFDAHNKKDLGAIRKGKENHYQAIMIYDIWLRKFMNELKLYIKESESTPGSSLFGRAFGKKRR